MAIAQTSHRSTSLPLEVLPYKLAVCRLAPASEQPAWVHASAGFLTISRTATELSITAEEQVIPADTDCERGYRALRVKGSLPLDLIGVLASLAGPLAEAGISIFAISTYDTDYVLVKGVDLDTARRVLERAGHRFQ